MPTFQNRLALENTPRFDLSGRVFHSAGDPFASLQVGNVHELGANGPAIDGSGLRGPRAVVLEFGAGFRLEKLKRIKPCSQITPAAKFIENHFALFDGFGRNASSLRSYFGHERKPLG